MKTNYCVWPPHPPFFILTGVGSIHSGKIGNTLEIASYFSRPFGRKGTVLGAFAPKSKEEGMGVEPMYIRSAVGYRELIQKLDWSKFRKWLDDRLQSHYTYNVYLYAGKYSNLAFTQEFADMPPNRKMFLGQPDRVCLHSAPHLTRR